MPKNSLLSFHFVKKMFKKITLEDVVEIFAYFYKRPKIKKKTLFAQRKMSIGEVECSFNNVMYC